MTIDEARQLIEQAEPMLTDSNFVIVHVFECNGKKMALGITDRFRSVCEKSHVWKSKKMLTAIKNAKYGFDRRHAQSPGGRDGIFILTRNHKPKNEMMNKLFDRFIDKPERGADAIAKKLQTSLNDLIPVRLVSHHMRLLGLLKDADDESVLILVDYDATK